MFDRRVATGALLTLLLSPVPRAAAAAADVLHRAPESGSIACQSRRTIKFNRPNVKPRTDITERTRRHYWGPTGTRLDESGPTSDGKGTFSNSNFPLDGYAVNIFPSTGTVQFTAGSKVGPRSVVEALYCWGVPLVRLVAANPTLKEGTGGSVTVEGHDSKETQELLGSSNFTIHAVYAHPEDAVPSAVQVADQAGEVVEDASATDFRQFGALRYPQRVTLRAPRGSSEQQLTITDVKTPADPAELQPRVTRSSVVMDTRLDQTLAYPLEAGEVVPDIATARRIHEKDAFLPRLRSALAAVLLLGVLVLWIFYRTNPKKAGAQKKPVA